MTNKSIKGNVIIEMPILKTCNYDLADFLNNTIENIVGNAIMLRSYEIGIVKEAYLKNDKFIIKGGLYNSCINLEDGSIKPYKDKTKNKIMYRFKFKKGKIID